MSNSDVVVAWVKSDGSTHFSDRHTSPLRELVLDKTQNWFPLTVKMSDGYTVAKFTRKIILCDTTNEDRDIESGTPFVIYAWGNTAVTSDATYHGSSNRGSKTVPLITTLNAKVSVNMNEVEMTDFRVNVSLNTEKLLVSIQKLDLYSRL